MESVALSKPFWMHSVTELSQMLDHGEVSPVELTEGYLARCDRSAATLNTFSHLATDTARAAARAAEKRQTAGARLGPLDGIPVSVKDNLFVAGMPATWGSRLFERHVPEHDDIVVERLRRAGCIILGKTNTPEFAMAGWTDNLLFGPTRNPWDPQLGAGGSSGGAAASVAAGLCPLAIGTDAGGSARVPASYNGVVGLRPSNGRVPRRFGFPPMAIDFQVVSPIARTVADLRLLFDAISGPDARDPLSDRFPASGAGASDVRLRVATSVGNSPVDPEVRRQVHAASQEIAKLGFAVDEGPVPYDLETVRSVFRTLTTVGVAHVVTGIPDWQSAVGVNAAAMADAGAQVSATDYACVLDALAGLRSSVSESWRDFDVLITPSATTVAWPVGLTHPPTIDGKVADGRSATAFTTWVNACGLPALSIPIGFSPAGLPIGMQLIGRYGADTLLLDIASQFEAARPWSGRWPDVACEFSTQKEF